MKALTICQPYAELIASGEKRVENRRWPTTYRGPLAIHAGKSLAWLGPDDPLNMAFGAVVAVISLMDCVRVADMSEEEVRLQLEHVSGPWCWLLSGLQRLPEPVPCAGRQRLWVLPDDVLADVSAQLRRRP